MLRRAASTMFPHFAQGEVVKGFGRGSKQLGIPTANFPDDVVEKLPADFECGIYFGWASVDDGPIHKMVMSVGWNPFYNNKKRTMETHILHKFQDDFYNSILKVCISGYIRPEKNFSSVDALISAIKEDIRQAEEKLSTPEHSLYKENNFFKTIPNGTS